LQAIADIDKTIGCFAFLGAAPVCDLMYNQLVGSRYSVGKSETSHRPAEPAVQFQQYYFRQGCKKIAERLQDVCSGLGTL